MKPILPKGSISLKFPNYTKSIEGNISPLGVTILVLPSKKSTLQMKNTNSAIYIHKETNSSNLQLSDCSTENFCNSVFVKNEQQMVMPMSNHNSVHQQNLKDTFKDSIEIKNKIVKKKIKLKKKKLNCHKLKEDIKDRPILLATKVEMKGYPVFINDVSSSEEQYIKVNRTSENYDRYKSLFFNDLEPMSENYLMKSKDVFKDKNRRNFQSDTNFVERGKISFNDMHSEILTRTENPPSYEAHFSQSPSSYIGVISHSTIPPFISKFNSSNHAAIQGTRYFPPPYFPSSESHINRFCINSKDDSATSNCIVYQTTYSNKISLDNKSSDVNGGIYHENYSKTYSAECIPHEDSNYYYDEEPRDYSTYSDNSVSQLKKKELNACETLEYIKTFTDRALSVMNQSFVGNETYQMRQKHAMDILNSNLSNLDSRRQALKDNFWIVEDEPLIDNSVKNVEKISLFPKSNKVRSKEYVCHICGKLLTGSNSFTSHLNRHLKKKSYRCQYCVRKFSHICSLKYHILTHTGENPYACQICSKSFKSLSNLNKHLIVHSHQRLFKCSTCSKSFKTNISLQIHIKRHFSQSHDCKICHCPFESRKALTTHIQRKHKDQKLFTCQECGKSYQYQCLLNQHVKVHSNELGYICHLCNAAFVWRSGLASHLKTHSFKLQCEICSSKFTSLKKLDKHRHQHSDPFPHKCIKCKREFKYAYLLKNHLNKHKDELVCTTCNLGFITKTKLKKHLKIYCGLKVYKS